MGLQKNNKELVNDMKKLVGLSKDRDKEEIIWMLGSSDNVLDFIIYNKEKVIKWSEEYRRPTIRDKKELHLYKLIRKIRKHRLND